MTVSKLPLSILAAAALVAGSIGLVATRDAGSAGSTGAASLQATYVDVYRRVAPSVVQIESSSGLGSGVVFDRAGHIVTNSHVVGGGRTFTVTSWNGKRYRATLVGTFPRNDVAVIKIPAGKLKPAVFGRSAKLRVGDITMAIGNPLGLSSSVTEGIVSALGRTPSEGGGTVIPHAIQTSAPINPGNSGGALVDLAGRVIGIPTLAALDPQLGGAAVGIGFAIPSDDVRDLASQIIRHGRVVNSHRAFLGITPGETGRGVYVGELTAGGPAARAGIRVGDVIVALAGKPTPTLDALASVLAGLKPGQTVKAKVTHQNGSTTVVDVKLGELPA